MTLPLLTHVLARRPAPNLAQGLTTQSHLGQPDYALTLRQIDAYLDALHACGLGVTRLPYDERFPDGHFVEDAAVVFRDMVFLSQSGQPSRRGEAAAIAETLHHLRQVSLVGSDARLEGGDVLFCADRVLIGLSGRTNRAGAEQLRAALLSAQADLRVDFVPLRGVLHLKTGLTELAPGLLLQSPAIQMDYDLSFAETILLPPAEAFAANVLPVNDAILIPAGCPTVAALAEQHYTTVHTLDISEITKMDGGLTCLSLRY